MTIKIFNIFTCFILLLLFKLFNYPYFKNLLWTKFEYKSAIFFCGSFWYGNFWPIINHNTKRLFCWNIWILINNWWCKNDPKRRQNFFLTITVNLVNSKNLRQLGWYYSTESQKYKICAIIINFYLAECLLPT